MASQVSMGATLKCSFGAAPSSLVVLPTNKVFAEGPPAANIMDHIPLVNIMPFGMCNSLANPTVAAATAAAPSALADNGARSPWKPPIGVRRAARMTIGSAVIRDAPAVISA